ncbi:MAG: fructose bisphosphate aldolase [Actinomycetota bacterium]
MHAEQLERVGSSAGFIAALDQSGGSTPGALARYGIGEDAYDGEAEMYDMVHAMRSRIMTAPAFAGDRVLGAILFEMTMDREVEGVPTPTYLWETKQVVPFLKVDKGLEDVADGVQLMKPMPELDGLLSRANAKGVFGTKMRSVVKQASVSGVGSIVAQQFEVGRRILDAGLMPILEPEVDIHCPDKAEAEALLLEAMLAGLDRLGTDEQVMFKLTIPSTDNLYTDLIADPRVLRVVALSGGYERDDANRRLTANQGMIASFSRALAEGLSADQTDAEFNETLDAAIAAIHAASST